ncbi:hypothetical protein DNFV4_03006 [Nitrospira tepida]|uniref:Uncharacterized protein n=1 Tax=Nitrospira tepida TaxID=2973512 RepID=A0AA86N0U6_9BACT|nr:hypothetical protein [Nitrospira tepida]CAI4032576.1 hypothetical protein DNFV4_03006 [Nitrospira tepida]
MSREKVNTKPAPSAAGYFLDLVMVLASVGCVGLTFYLVLIHGWTAKYTILIGIAGL